MSCRQSRPWCSLPESDFFDPGNYLYQLALRLVWGPLWENHRWNQETCGDFFEAVMGLAWLRRFESEDNIKDSRKRHSLQLLREIAKWMDSYVYSLWALLRVGGFLDMPIESLVIKFKKQCSYFLDWPHRP